MHGRKLLAFSGLDGGGKSTQIDLLQTSLKREGRRTRHIWIRGGYTSGMESMKNILRRLPADRGLPAPGPNPQRTRAFSNGYLRRLWLTVSLLDLMRLCVFQVRWWKWRGETVICDRYIWDSLIDFRLNFPSENVESWWLWKLLSSASARPDATFLMLVPVEESIRRSDIKGEPFRDSREVLDKRLAAYQELARRHDWVTLDGCLPASALAEQIREEIGLR